jgi:hypothetical protein
VPWVASAKVLDIPDHLHTMRCGVRPWMPSAEAQQTTDEAFAQNIVNLAS